MRSMSLRLIIVRAGVWRALSRPWARYLYSVALLRPKSIAASEGVRNGLFPTLSTMGSWEDCSASTASIFFCFSFALYALSIHILEQYRVVILCAIKGFPHHWHRFLYSIFCLSLWIFNSPTFCLIPSRIFSLCLTLVSSIAFCWFSQRLTPVS